MTLASDPSMESMAKSLREHLDVCNEVLALTRQENELLIGTDSYPTNDFTQRRKTLLPRLNQTLDSLARCRQNWQQLGPTERARNPEVTTLLRSSLDLIMKIIVLDRENEQLLLRRGLVPPRHLPPVERQRPHFVAQMYRKNANG